VQADPIKPTLKAPATKRLKVKHDQLLSSFAFNFILRRYIAVQHAAGTLSLDRWASFKAGAYNRPLISST